jgi:hypothetical protein
MTDRARSHGPARRHAGGRVGRTLAAAVAVFLACASMAADAEVVTYDADGAFDGFNLLVSQDPPGAVLMDMEGKTLHRWTCRLSDAFPGADVPAEPLASGHCAAARLLPNGSVLLIFEGVGLVKLSPTSRLLWTHAGGEHGDLEVGDDGAIYVLGSRWNRVNWVNQKESVLEDQLLILSERGDVTTSVSLLSAIWDSEYSNMIRASHMERDGHVLRANALDVLDGSDSDRIPSFRKGAVLVSLPRIDTIVVVDPASKAVTWALFGMWLEQADAALVPDGDVLLLEGPDGVSRVLEFDPVTTEIEWEFERGAARSSGTHWSGSCQRLPNGNTLISESALGRAYEITANGEVVWEYASPEAANPDERALVPFEVVRIEPGFPMDWLGD